ncbi:hypothetical protein GGI07_004111 [Coemansia sp. Benny D115]|nr:hypothetical protein GGI07_004111 [Coemansia sp. Benny D115]
MHRDLAATTSDTIRIWDLDISASKQKPYGGSAYQRGRRYTSDTLTSDGIGGDSRGTGDTGLLVTDSGSHMADSVSSSVGDYSCVSWSADGSTFVAGGRGSAIRQFNKQGELLQDVCLAEPSRGEELLDIVAMQHCGHNSESLYIADNASGQVRCWNFVKQKFIETCHTHRGAISCMAVNTRRKIVASATSDTAEIVIYNTVLKTRTELESVAHKALTSIDVSSGIRYHVAVGSEDGMLQLFDNASLDPTPLSVFADVHSAPVRGISFHQPTNSSIISAGLDGRIVVTDVNSYSSATTGRSALSISTGAPLTCMTSCADPFAIGAGTVQGTVVVYDLRQASAPLWEAKTGDHRAVTSVSFSHGGSLAQDGASNPPRRPTSTLSSRREFRGAGGDSDMRGSSSGSGEGIVQTMLAERRRARLSLAGGGITTRERSTPVPKITASTVKSDSAFRPPQHPIIGRHRSALAELQNHSTPTNASAKAPSSLSSSYLAPHDGMTSGKAHLSPVRGKRPHPEDDGMVVDENASIMRFDRSFMQMLSPPKVTGGGRRGGNANGAGKGYETGSSAFRETRTRKEVLTMLSDSDDPASPQKQSAGNAVDSRRTTFSKHTFDFDFARAAERQSTGSSSTAHASDAEVVDRKKPEPEIPAMSLHAELENEQKKSAMAHDVGDSMMELFTPERKKPAIAPRKMLDDSWEEDELPSPFPRSHKSPAFRKLSESLDMDTDHQQPLPDAQKTPDAGPANSVFAAPADSAPSTKPSRRRESRVDQTRAIFENAPAAQESFKTPRRASVYKHLGTSSSVLRSTPSKVDMVAKTFETQERSAAPVVSSTAKPVLASITPVLERARAFETPLASTKSKPPADPTPTFVRTRPLESAPRFSARTHREAAAESTKRAAPRTHVPSSTPTVAPTKSTAGAYGTPAVPSLSAAPAKAPTQAPVPAPAPAATMPSSSSLSSMPATTGLGSVSSSILQNLLSDALTPLRDQLSGEIRNLHLDMIRQNFVYQEQIETLRKECSEARTLRQEMEQLRRENEHLKRYVPFYNFIGDKPAAAEGEARGTAGLE